MKKFVKIQSDVNIEVTEGLQSIDMTNRDAHVADRLRVAPAWVQTRVMIKRGAGVYPACIQYWATVKALADNGVLTIGTETDEGDATAEETLARLEHAQAEREHRAEAAKNDSIVGTDKPAPRKTTVKRSATTAGDIIEQ